MKQNITTTLQNIGPVIRKTMGEVIDIIRNETATFIAHGKQHYDGVQADFVTTADLAAQARYVEVFEAEFPGFGMRGEENGLNRPCTIDGEDIKIIFDPLDGTKAYIRRESHGVGTMVAVTRNGKVIAAYVGDVNTGEMYGFAPDQPIPTRLQFGVESFLEPKADIPLSEKYVMFDTAPSKYHPVIQKMILTPKDGGLFKDIQAMCGSYGLLTARLWKGEIAAAFFDGGFCTPWDETPVLGISDALGFVHIKFNPKTAEFGVIHPVPKNEVVKIDYDTIVVHKDYAPRILEWLEEHTTKLAVAA